MTNKILFLDIDGPLIPGRLFVAEGKKECIPFEVSKFDHVAVDMINRLCAEHGWELVLHSSWVRIVGGRKTFDHCIEQGLLFHNFHDDPWCDEEETWRYTRVAKWLEKHPKFDDYLILDDTPYESDSRGNWHPKDMKDHLIQVSFENGMMYEHFRKIAER